jgi:hypothetical protein
VAIAEAPRQVRPPYKRPMLSADLGFSAGSRNPAAFVLGPWSCHWVILSMITSVAAPQWAVLRLIQEKEIASPSPKKQNTAAHDR